MEADDPCLSSWCDGNWRLVYRTGLGLMFLSFLVVSTFGNTMVWCVVRRSRRPQSTTNYFVLSLAAGDMLFGAALVPVMVGELWATENTAVEPIIRMCSLTLLVVLLTGAMQAFILTMVSMDRFYAISQSGRVLISRLVARRLVTLAWGAALLVALPMVISTPLSGEYPRGHKHVFSSWCLMSPPGYAYGGYTFCTFLLPVFGTAVIYIRLFIHQRQKRRSNIPLSQSGRMRWQRVHMLVTVTSLHVVAWLPLNISFCVSLMSKPFSPHSMPALLLLAYAMGSVRPIIYYFWNPDFKQGCREIFYAPPSPSCRSNAYIITCPAIPSQRSPVEQPACPSTNTLGRTPFLPNEVPTTLQREAGPATNKPQSMYDYAFDDDPEVELSDENIAEKRHRNHSGNAAVDMVLTRCTCQRATSLSQEEDILLGNMNIGKSGDYYCSCFTSVASWSHTPQKEPLKGSQMMKDPVFYAAGEKESRKLQTSMDRKAAPTSSTLIIVKGEDSDGESPLGASNRPSQDSCKVSHFSSKLLSSRRAYGSDDQQNADDSHEFRLCDMGVAEHRRSWPCLKASKGI